MKQKVDYLLGIKGVGMTALAACLLDAGHEVRGVDVPDDFVTASQLTQLGVVIDDQHSTTDLPPSVTRVVMSSACDPASSPLLEQARQRGVPIFTHAQALAELVAKQRVVAVAGVGGKSTVSAMLAFIAERAGFPAGYAVGVGEILGLARTGRFPTAATWFILEADEYADNPYLVRSGQASLRPRFSYFQPEVVICTNLAFDHPDVYSSVAETRAQFARFFRQIKRGGTLIWNGDDEILTEMVTTLRRERPDLRVVSFAHQHPADYEVELGASEPGQTQVRVNDHQFTLRLPGLHNALNAAAALAAAASLAWPSEAVCQQLSAFASTKRRAELVKRVGERWFYDDYAHHPLEIKAILSSLRTWFPDHYLSVVFEPHTYSRTLSLWSAFATAFEEADQLIVTPTFASSREASTQDPLHERLAQEIKKTKTNSPVESVHSYAEAISKLELDREKLVLVTLGAGNIYQLQAIIAQEVVAP